MKLKRKRINSVSIADASLITGRDKMTIWRWIRAKRVTARKDRTNYRWKIVLKSLKKYLAKRKGGGKHGNQKRTGNRKSGIGRGK